MVSSSSQSRFCKSSLSPAISLPPPLSRACPPASISVLSAYSRVPEGPRLTDQCISINHNFFSSPTLPRIYDALLASQARVEESIADVKEMIIERLGCESGDWEVEWIEEVQGLLERDAGWGWVGFWECVKRNLLVRIVSTLACSPHDNRISIEAE